VIFLFYKNKQFNEQEVQKLLYMQTPGGEEPGLGCFVAFTESK
jgi:hypothetical protein